MSFLELARKRRSVREFRADVVPEALLTQVLEAARHAPSADDRKPWTFVVVRDETRRRALCAAAHDHWFAQAPVVIVACVDLERAWARPSDQRPFGDVDTALAVDHLTLCAADVGLGSCWFSQFEPYVVRNILELPANLEPLVMVPLGYPASPTSDLAEAPAPRSARVHWEVFSPNDAQTSAFDDHHLCLDPEALAVAQARAARQLLETETSGQPASRPSEPPSSTLRVLVPRDAKPTGREPDGAPNPSPDASPDASPNPSVAFFCVEGVLLKPGLLSFSAYLAANAQGMRERFVRLGLLAIGAPAYALFSHRDPSLATRAIYASLRGMSTARVRELAEEYFDEVVRSRAIDAGRDLLRQARKDGYRPILLSDGFEEVVERMAKLFGIEDYHGNRLEFVHGECTGRLTEPLFGGHQVSQWLRSFAEAQDIDLKSSTAYASRHSEMLLLSTVGKPCAVNPDRRMRAAARDCHWPIVEY